VRAAAVFALLLGTACGAATAQEMPPGGDSLPVGDAPAPAVVRDDLADRRYGVARMDRARAILAAEHGGAAVSKVMGNLLEYTTSSEGSGYRWDGEAWYGTDRDRLVVKTEGEGLRRAPLDDAEVQALYSRAVGPYTDLQAGVRYELEPAGRAHATVAVETLLPFWFKVQAALFVSDRGDVSSRLEGHYDLRLTHRLILQPRVEMMLAAEDVPDTRTGSGLSSAELGLRLRYEVRREFAPYIGVNYAARLGRTADFARAAGNDAADISFLLGLRAWF
jgi:copper resistance protein B